MNSLYQQLRSNQSSSNSNLKQLISSLKRSSNPQQLLTTLAQSNPNVSSILSTLQNTGQTPKQLFYQLAQQRGINPDDIISMIQQA